MAQKRYDYVIAGAGLTGISAVEGIRELDKDGSILMIGNETVMPYERPPLTKKLWFGKKNIQDAFVRDSGFYIENNVDLKLGTHLVGLNAGAQSLVDQSGNTYRYDKLLLALGGVPHKLGIPGDDLWGICYYRYMADYLRIRRDAAEGKTAVVIGGGYIGSEITAALTINKVDVTMLFPEPYIVSRVFPADLGNAVQADYTKRGVRVLAGDAPVSFEKNGSKFITNTRRGEKLESDMIIAGVGINPAVNLAEQAGLSVENGVAVDNFVRTEDPAIFAAGDNAYFPYAGLDRAVRVEHWDNAIHQGKQAGRNMAGANEPYNYMPYFFSDLFDFGYEAVGEITSHLKTFADWDKEFDTGVVYYMKDDKVKGVMTCNIFGKMDAARELIKSGKRMTQDDLRGAISRKETVAV